MKVNWASLGYSRATALLPELKLGKPLLNAQHLISLFKEQAEQGSSVVITPELALTGYTCEDLFHTESLIRETEEALLQIVQASKGSHGLWAVGAPLRLPDGRLYNGAFAISAGKILGFVPKIFLPNMGEFYERRWFVSGRNLHQEVEHPTLGTFFASSLQVFSGGALRVGIEICQDLWSPVPPSTNLALKGANLIVNLSASNELVGKPKTRKMLAGAQSERTHSAYLYVSSGTGESSKDTVFSAHTFAFELGFCLMESLPFEAGAKSRSVLFDLELILNSRSKDICFLEAIEQSAPLPVKYHSFPFNIVPLGDFERPLPAYPFLAEIENPEDAIEIQVQGLLRRAQSSKAKSLIIGISGGLDSTLALLIALRVKAILKDAIQVIGVTLPGPGTSEQTLGFARTLLSELKLDQQIEVPIHVSVDQHLKDIGKLPSDRSVVYENAQARERTQILFDLANEHQGLLVGTGDLSELALGWCTFNADHMAHYAVNSGIPKTTVRKLVAHFAEQSSVAVRALLKQILSLPISPELLPPSASGEISQETEALIGAYDLHDFFIYHLLKEGFSKEKIHALALHAFRNEPALLSQLELAFNTFFKRFFSQQFKRTTLPPGPKVHSVGLSPRSDFRLPDEL